MDSSSYHQADRISAQVIWSGRRILRSAACCLHVTTRSDASQPARTRRFRAGPCYSSFTKNDFRYDRERDLYVCPAGQELTFRHASHEKGRDVRLQNLHLWTMCAVAAM